MKIYKNKELTQEIVDKTFDLGILFAGHTKQYTYYMYNETKALYRDLKVEINHKEVSVIQSPEILKAKEAKKLIIEWKPSITLKEGLKAPVHITGEELWG